MPLAADNADGEMATPTGAALLATLVDTFGGPPAGRIVRTGAGLGTRAFPGFPGFLRVLIIEEASEK